MDDKVVRAARAEDPPVDASTDAPANVSAEELTDEQADAVAGGGAKGLPVWFEILKSVRDGLISSQAVKQDVCRVENPPDLLASIVPVEFRYTDDVWAVGVSQRERDRRHVGFIAEDVPPAAQICDPDGVPYDVDARAMVAYLWAEVQALRAELTQLRGRIPT